MKAIFMFVSAANGRVLFDLPGLPLVIADEPRAERGGVDAIGDGLAALHGRQDALHAVRAHAGEVRHAGSTGHVRQVSLKFKHLFSRL